jgi:type IV pilus assembly protein PilY1
VLYGGTRDTDTATETILRRAYIPQDGHSWAKEYTSLAVDGYRIGDYTPLAEPEPGRRHFFGNLTRVAGLNCTTLDTCSKQPPLLSVVTNSNRRVWEWASSEAPVLGKTPLADGSSPHGGTMTEYTVRVLACPKGYTHGCKTYGTAAKPVGVLHEFGEDGTLLFGLLTGSYDRNLSGGRLRKPVAPFGDEIQPSDGTFRASAPLVRTLAALRIRDFNNGITGNSYRGGRNDTGVPPEGVFPDWGNPIGEMMYEGLRYFAGKGAPTPDYAGDTTVDTQVGLPSPAWDDPYARNSQAQAPLCARASLLVVSDTNVSYDSDQVSGAAWPDREDVEHRLARAAVVAVAHDHAQSAVV